MSTVATGFSKQLLVDYGKQYGYTNVDDGACTFMTNVVKKLVWNLLNNVFYVTSALKVKRIRKEHFEGVLSLLRSHNIQAGGHAGTVLPGEYFGVDSGRYFNDVSTFESSAFANNLSRAELPIKMMSAGGSTKPFINVKNIKDLIAKYMNEKKIEGTIGTSAVELMIASIYANLDRLLKASAKGSRAKSPTLTKQLLVQTIQKKVNQDKLAHMA
jgi:hypothetical protein